MKSLGNMLFTSPLGGICKDIIKLDSVKVEACQRQVGGKRTRVRPKAGGAIRPRPAKAPQGKNSGLKYQERLAAARVGKTPARLRADKKRSYMCCAYKVAFREGKLKGMGTDFARVHAQKLYADAGATFERKFPKCA